MSSPSLPVVLAIITIIVAVAVLTVVVVLAHCHCRPCPLSSPSLTVIVVVLACCRLCYRHHHCRRHHCPRRRHCPCHCRCCSRVAIAIAVPIAFAVAASPPPFLLLPLLADCCLSGRNAAITAVAIPAIIHCYHHHRCCHCYCPPLSAPMPLPPLPPWTVFVGPP